MAVQIGWYGVQVEDRSRCFVEESVGFSFIGLGLRTRVERGGEDGVDNDRWGRFQDRIRPFDGFLNSGADVVVVDLQELLIEEIPVSLFPFHGRIIPLDHGAVYGQRPTLSGLSPWDAAQSGASRMGPMNSNTRAGACGIHPPRAFTEQGVAALQRIEFDPLRSQIAILNAARKSNDAASLSINGTQSGQGCAP